MILNWEITKVDHIGGREEQQDNVATFSTPDGQSHLLVVADGMGGHKGGRIASYAVVKSAQLGWQKYRQCQMAPPQFLQFICELAHKNINLLGKKYHISPRSTVVLLYIRGKKAWWAYIGDSRLYHFRRYKLLYRTKDHSIVQMLVDLGRVNEEDMATHSDQGRLLKGLGGDEVIQASMGQTSVHPGDSFVLCSDGFWEQISPSKMLDKLSQTHLSLGKQVKELVKEAFDAGGDKGDNIAVAVARLKEKTFLNIITYLIISLIIIILGGGVWYYFKSYASSSAPMSVTTKISNPTDTPLETEEIVHE